MNIHISVNGPVKLLDLLVLKADLQKIGYDMTTIMGSADGSIGFTAIPSADSQPKPLAQG